MAQLRELAPKMLKVARLEYNTIECCATPRRQGFLVRDLAPQQTPLDSMVRGPALKAAYDKDGKPTKAAEGFARGQGVDVHDLIKVEETFIGDQIKPLRKAERFQQKGYNEALDRYREEVDAAEAQTDSGR